MYAVLASLVIAGNRPIPAEHVLLEMVRRPLGSEVVPGVRRHCTGVGPCRRELLRPLKSTVVNVNQNSKVLKEIPPNDHVMGIQPDNKHRKVVDPAAINLNIKREVLSDGGSLGPVISLRIDSVGKPSRPQPKSSTKIRCETSIQENEPTCSGITEGIDLKSNSVLADRTGNSKRVAAH